MAAAVRQETGASGGDGDVNVAFVSNVLSGSILVALVVVQAGSGDVTSVSDDVNGAWTKKGETEGSTPSSNTRVEAWAFEGAAAGATTVSLDMSASSLTWINIFELTGTSMQFADLVSASGSADPPSAGTVTLAGTSAAVLTGMAVEGTGGSDLTASGWTRSWYHPLSDETHGQHRGGVTDSGEYSVAFADLFGALNFRAIAIAYEEGGGGGSVPVMMHSYRRRRTG